MFRSQPHSQCRTLATITFWLILIILTLPLYAEESNQEHPRVFQSDETQHGFSSFESLPEVYSSTPEEHMAHDNLKPPIETDQPPKGVFYRLDFTKEVDDDEGIRRGHFVTPINPTSTLPSDGRPVYLVFRVHSHYASYQVFGKLYPENIANMDSSTLIDEDAMHLTPEDDSGYLQFDPPSATWPAGKYQVKIFVGYEASQFNLMGTMRFSVAPSSNNAG